MEDFLQQQPTFDPKKIEPGAVIRVTSQLFPVVKGSYAWNALVVKVEPFEVTVARLHSSDDEYQNDYGGTAIQRIHIDAVVRKDAKLEIIRQA